MNTNYAILAPHIDDELIGCFRLLDQRLVKKVVYFYECTDARIQEALTCSTMFGFEPVFLHLEIGELPKNDLDLQDFTVLLPNIADHHEHHKLVNAFGRKLPNRQFYSVDMNVQLDVLNYEDRAKKKLALETLYPSQRVLTDERYHLFESVLPSDLCTSISVKTTFEGIHQYLNAPDEVYYLRYPHRHVFHVDVTLDVFHDDREVEFIIFKHQVEDFIRNSDLNNKSCEQIAAIVLEHVICLYSGRSCTVRVFEDAESGATVTFAYR